MQLLPIIIVVSLLGLLLVISLVLFVWHYMKVRARGQRLQVAPDNQRPPRQLTLQSGKVVPKSEAFQSPSTRDVRSLDMSTMRSGNSVKSKFSQDGHLHSPRATLKSFDRRRSSVLADVEAQNEAAETWEANVKDLHHLDERLREPRHVTGTKDGEVERRVSISSQKITASLKKAYKGTPVLETETLEIPPILGSRSAEIRTMVRKNKSDPNVGRFSLGKSYHNAHETKRFSQGPPRKKHHPQPCNRNTSRGFPQSIYAAPTNAVQPPSPLFPTNRHSSPVNHSLDNPTRTLFLSKSASSTSISPLPPPPLLPRAPPPSIEGNQSRQESPLTPLHNTKVESPRSLEARGSNPYNIDTNVPNVSEISFIESATSSATTPQGFQRDSMMSNSSLATFASSDLSSTWTFGRAQPIAILPGIMSRARPTSPASRRPKSKYGRYSKPRNEKDLPILPRSPLAR